MFAWLELRTYCHATEDQEKVVKALAFICPQANLRVAKVEGHNRNPILVMTARADSPRAIKDFWRLMRQESLIGKILGNGRKMMDDNGILHIRLGKQEAYQGRAILSEREDVISARLKVVKYAPSKQDAFDTVRETIEELTKIDVSHT